MQLSTESIIAIIGVVGTLAGSVSYSVKKWADMRTLRAKHELALEEKRHERDSLREQKQEEREAARVERDLKTAEYIAVNTESIRALKAAVDAQTDVVTRMQATLIQELSTNLVSAVRENRKVIEEHDQAVSQRCAQCGQITIEMRDTVKRIEDRLDR